MIDETSQVQRARPYPALPAPGCPYWCRGEHADGEQHQSMTFDSEGDGYTLRASIVMPSGTVPARILVECSPARSDETSATPGLVLTLSAADELADSLMELLCIARRCRCNGDELCPGNPDFIGYLPDGVALIQVEEP